MSERRDRAIQHILGVLRNPLLLISKPDREDAEKLARDHGITAADLIAAATKKARKA